MRVYFVFMFKIIRNKFLSDCQLLKVDRYGKNDRKFLRNCEVIDLVKNKLCCFLKNEFLF